MFSHGAPVMSAPVFPSGSDGFQNHIISNTEFTHLFYRAAETIPPTGDEVQLDFYALHHRH